MAMGAEKDGVIVVDKRDKGRFLEARSGDHLMSSFQCDLCHFRNIHKRDPLVGENAEDFLLMLSIRRCNLDALWSKEPTTVENNRRVVEKTITKGSELGLQPSHIFPPKGCFSLSDDCMMAGAATMIHRSLDPGINDTCVQFNTVRVMRSAISNYLRASAVKPETTVLVRGQTKMIESRSPTNGDWFERFMVGFHKRVGDISQPDRAISIELMVALMSRFEERWELTQGNKEREKAVVFPALFALSAYVGSLRGEEVPLMNLEETRNNTQKGLKHKIPHVVVSLSGKFKNESGSFTYHIPMATKTNSGLEVQVWVERMLAWYGPNRAGYVFRDKDGNRVATGHYATDILSVINEIKESDRPSEMHLVDEDCDVFEEFGMSRSFRRGSTSRAIAARVSELTIDVMNRWRSSERAKGKQAQLKMNAHYSELSLLLNNFLDYTQAL